MTITALGVVVDAYEQLNRLSPGETLGADEAEFGFRRLNLLADQMSAQAQFLFRNVLTSTAQTGHITLGAGAWAAIAPGTDVVGVTVDGLPISRLTIAQYQQMQEPTQTGSPRYYAPDGLSTVYLYPVAAGQTVQLHTLVGVATFADLTTAYTVPQGYAAALGAALAVRLAPPVIGRLPPELVRAEMAAMGGIKGYTPAILNGNSYAGNACGPSILTG